MRWLRHLVLGSALAAAAQAQVVLNFDDLTLNNYDDIPVNYGSSLDPNLAGISYRTFLVSDNSTLTNQLDFWNVDYGDLSKVAFAATSNTLYASEISLVPAAGFGIRINSFDMAGWPNQDRTNAVMRLVDGAGNVLFDFTTGGPVLIQGDFSGARHSSFSPNIFYAGTVRFQWGNDWDIGLDNLNFDLVAIPEPAVSTLALGVGAAAICWRWRRRARNPVAG